MHVLCPNRQCNVYLINLTGLTITEVAHDCQPQVSKYVTEGLPLINSYDTWHGECYILLCGICVENADYI